MSSLLIRPADTAALREALARARAKPIPWDRLRQSIPRQNEETDTLTLADRPAGFERPRSQFVLLPPGWTICISMEEQPAGWLLHISISTPRHGLPNPHAVKMIIEALGLEGRTLERFWDEEYLIDGKPGGHALNLLIMERPRADGHA